MANYKNLEIEAGLDGMMRNMQAVDECREELNNLQSVWDNLTLLGQLSGTGTNMNGTRQSFHQLTGSLLNQLASETLRKCVLEMTSKAQVAIDILVRNLFERTADIGFLATDEDICAALREVAANGQLDEQHLDALRERFAEYVAKYSVYSDVVLSDVSGRIVARLTDAPGITHTRHALHRNSLDTAEGYVETFDVVDFLPQTTPSLIYSFRVVDTDNTPLGVLCLCFRFDNELRGIFGNLVAPDDWSVITLLDQTGRVIASSDVYHIPLGAHLSPVLDEEYRVQRFAAQEYLACTRGSTGYQGYAGPPWHAQVMLPLQHAFNRDSSGFLRDIPREALDSIMEHSKLFSDSLRQIPVQAERIQRDLNRSVWNGNVRQCRFGQARDTGFSKILLWEISNTGARTQSVFQRSIANLHETVVSSVLEDSRFQASLAIDIMDRNLYERANDCRWWALTSSFRELLANGEVSDADRERIGNVLAYINNLYTVYTNLIVFDVSGKILAVSNPAEGDLVGQSVGEEWYRRVPAIGDSQGYVVSDFLPSHFYAGRHTYIYGAAIRDPAGSRVVGGIGIVFDSAPQFSAMLCDALPKDANGRIDAGSFGVFASRDGRVIACSDERFKPGERLPLAESCFDLEPGTETTGVIPLSGHYYAVGAHASSGYREYKSDTDSYQNEVIAIVCKELCPITERQLQDDDIACPSIRSDRGHGANTVEVATFQLAQKWFGLRATQVLESVDISNITPAPGAGVDCIGYLTYEKMPMPVFDIRSMLGLVRKGTEFTQRKAQPVVVVEKNPHTRFGIVVDALGEIPEVEESRISALPEVVSGGAMLADAAITPDNPAEDSLLLVLSVDRLSSRLASGMVAESRARAKTNAEVPSLESVMAAAAAVAE